MLSLSNFPDANVSQAYQYRKKQFHGWESIIIVGNNGAASSKEKGRGRWRDRFIVWPFIFSTGLVAAVLAAAAWFAQAWFGASPGVVYKCDTVYDFIVVGGGTAGSVVAARLSEIPYIRVLLLEAGGEEPWLASIPLAAPLLQGSRYDWKYMTAPQKTSSEALVDKVMFQTDLT